MSAGSEVEQRRLAAIGIADECHIDGVTGRMNGIMGRNGHILRFTDILGILGVGTDLNLISLLTAQADLVTHDLIFDRVLQRCAQQHLDTLALDKAHFNNALAEATVSLYLNNIGLVARIQFGKFHRFLLFACKDTTKIPHGKLFADKYLKIMMFNG